MTQRAWQGISHGEMGLFRTMAQQLRLSEAMVRRALLAAEHRPRGLLAKVEVV